MANAKRDANRVTTSMGVSSADNSTPLNLRVDATTKKLLMKSTTDSLDVVASTKNERDANGVPTIYGVSDADGKTVLPIRTDSSGNILVQLG